MGLIAKQDKKLFEELEKHLYKFKEQCNSRLAYGGLYGSYKTNSASHYFINFFEEEFANNKKEISK